MICASKSRVSVRSLTFLAMVCCAMAVSTCLQAADSVSEMKRVTIPSASMSILDASSMVSEQTGIAICVEDLIIYGETRKEVPTKIFSIEDQPVSQALDYIILQYKTHKWKSGADGTMINLIPASIKKGTDWWLDHLCPEFRLEKATVTDAVLKMNKVLAISDDRESRISCGMGASIGGPDREAIANHPMTRLYNGRLRITTTIKAGTIREALNQIASAADNAWWYYSESRGDGWRRRSITFYPTEPNTVYHGDASKPASLFGQK